MVDDTDPREAEHDDASRSEVESSPTPSSDIPSILLGLTRREFMVGSASALTAGPTAAADVKIPQLDVSYEDGTRRGLVITWVEPLPVDQQQPSVLKDKRY